MSGRLSFAFCSLAVISGCSRPQARADAAPLPAGPVITRLDPASGPAGVAYPIRVTIEGRAFAPASNTVRFGPVELPGLPSTDGGTRIVFFAPKETPSRSEVPPAPLLPGPYDVTVTTVDGTSRPAVFTLSPESGARR